MKKVFIIIAVVIAVVCIIVGGIFYFLNSQAKEAFVSFSEDKIPTVYSIVGEKSIGSYKTSTGTDYEKKSFSYRAGELSSDDIKKYVESLRQDKFVLIRKSKNADGESLQFASESKEEGYILLVDLNIKLTGLDISYTKVKGKLDRFES